MTRRLLICAAALLAVAGCEVTWESGDYWDCMRTFADMAAEDRPSPELAHESCMRYHDADERPFPGAPVVHSYLPTASRFLRAAGAPSILGVD